MWDWDEISAWLYFALRFYGIAQNRMVTTIELSNSIFETDISEHVDRACRMPSHVRKNLQYGDKASAYSKIR